jgi:NAD-dependent dihydropyrimidine dehydrogenase PreA subunit
MKVDEAKCIGCLECVDYCPVSAIKEVSGAGHVIINEEECVECGCCLRVEACAQGALWQPELQWPRILRAQFSNPHVGHPSTGGHGRGTDEMKTNEITGNYPRGYIGVAAELGRPGLGTSMIDIEKVAQAMLAMGVELLKDNPTYYLFEDPMHGVIKQDVKKERVLSAIIECKTTPDKVPQVLATLKEVAEKIDTVISVDIASMLEPDGSLPAEDVARASGFEVRPNGKTNLGLGRPLLPRGGEK